VNIALVNETAIMCDKLGIDVWEVVEAAATKPYGFMKFTPGPGVGGHCIPLDPHYLSWKLKTLNYNARFIQLAGEINSDMPRYWVNKVMEALNDASKPLKGSRVLVLGVAYKKDIDDVRESPHWISSSCCRPKAPTCAITIRMWRPSRTTITRMFPSRTSTRPLPPRTA
jgi:UDP-N-acetyl-D-glucosamine dehydrogenase